MVIQARELIEKFRRRFPQAAPPALYRAPGRVNLIGEHTDYNQGFVLPIAIHLACYAAAAPTSSGLLRVHSENLDQQRAWPVEALAHVEPAGDWSDYVAGVARELLAAGFPVSAMDVLVWSAVPPGSGLSSSAALEVAVALALLGERRMDRRELALLCQRAENRFVGVPCGIMDQYVCLFGEPQSAIQIDCRSIAHSTVRLPEAVRIVVVNSMVKHELGASAYRDRVRECQQALAALREHYPELQSLRDVTKEQLESMRARIPAIPFRRARHVVLENLRVTQFVAACRQADLVRMGDLFVASHRSLQFDYEVSCAELDYLVEIALTQRGVFGARMTGGGFGGCTVNLVDPQSTDDFCSRVAAAYSAKFSLHPQVCVVEPSAAANQF